MSSRIPGFYRKSIAQRRAAAAACSGLPQEAFAAIDDGALPLEVADGMIENVIGTYALPFAVAVNFQIDGVDRLVPMVVEEPSVVAASSYAARMIRDSGGFVSTASAPVMLGQVQLVEVADVDRAVAALAEHRQELLTRARSSMRRLVERGGGPVDLTARILARPPGPDGGVVVVHLHVDCRDAMGANLINTLCEEMAWPLAELCQGRPGLRILSNLTDERTVTVRCRVAAASLAEQGSANDGARSASTRGAEVAEAVASASRFAELDPYRATTHNKGIMNGVDAVLLATGQDFRAVEAGAHAFAARSGVYRPLATWRLRGEGDAAELVGELTMPLAVGTVGGALHVHPGARLGLAICGATSANDLAAVVASAGLATNLAALRALATEGIQRGHMSLHARVLARAAGASGELLDRVAAELADSGDVRIECARQILHRLQASALER
ncbi:MAG: hydroxymethylglutaryl-CoA reductase, degradative [Myxococcales bacterium]|nr:hydroxymethylglutaryl-CoA reductase, degradative [Myxococcales bacterium]